MQAESKTCQNCKNQFTIEPEDFAFYERLKVPPPTFCPECRLIRRFAFRNERNLYKRKCDLCGQEKIMMYPPGTPFPVYCKPCWWSDNWDPRQYTKEYDSNRPFLEQFRELLNIVPRPGIIHQGNIVNSDYTNRVTDMKNCYLVFGTTVAENSRYSARIQNSKECMDCYGARRSERCYECIDCFQCYNLLYSHECNDCTDSYFLYNCRNLQNCFGCVNLRNKKYCIWNQQYTKEDYQKILAGYQLGNALMLEGLHVKFEALKKQFIVPWMVSYHNQNVSGNWIENSENLLQSFTCHNVEDGKYNAAIFDTKDAFDYSYWGASAERMYECINIGIQAAGAKFSSECWNQAIDLEYCLNCHNTQNLFGCIGLRSAKYSVLNKEYPEEEYKALVDKIRQDMNERPYADAKGRAYKYGEFFPAEFSPHYYNETIAQEFFPITREKAAEMGYRWKEDDTRNYQITVPAGNLPDAIADTKDDILNAVIECLHAGKCNQRCTTAFRIIPEELQAYRAFSIPLPKLCPNCRHFERLAKRNPLRLWSRKCQCAGEKSENGVYQNTGTHQSHGAGEHCPNKFQTSYAPDQPEIVYCESCYQSEIA